MTAPLSPPSRTEPCPCGSDRRFKRCCGRLDGTGSLPRGVGVVEGFLDRATCQRLREYAQSAARTDARVIPETEGERRASAGRSNQRVDTSGIFDLLCQIVRKAYREHVAPAYGVELAWMERPGLLAYGPNQRYRPHADSHAWSTEQGQWRKVLDRDYSALIYLDEGFTGGALRFCKFGYTVIPRTGMLVYFPADWRYAHEACPVETGQRHVVVGWAAAKDVPRVKAEPPSTALAV